MRESPKNESRDTEVQKKRESRREFLAKVGIGNLGMLLAGREKATAKVLGEELKESKEGHMPKVSFEIFFGFHKSPEDIKDLPQKIKESDIYIPEVVEWEEEYRDDYNRVSQGELTPEEFFSAHKIDLYAVPANRARFLELSALYKTKIPVLFLDLPADSEIMKRYEELVKEPELKGTFGEALQQVKEHAKKFVEGIRLRDEFFLERLEKTKKDIDSGAFPKLKGKDRIKILIQRGALHIPVYSRLKEKGEEVKQSFSGEPFLLSQPKHEMHQRAYSGEEISDQLAAKVFLADLIMQVPSANPLHFENSYEYDLWLKKAVSRFSMTEIKDLYEGYEGLGHDLYYFLEKILVRKNIPLPAQEL